MTTSENYQNVVEKICADTIAPQAPSVDANCTFPDAAVEALGSAGILGAVSGADVGGLGLGPRGAAFILRRIGQECGSTAMVTCMHFCGSAVLEAFASPEVRRASEYARVQRGRIAQPFLGAVQYGNPPWRRYRP
ncbi:MAG: acyl-CoA dehydrogenase family protein [Bryobacteraceae bacterium]